MTLQEKIRKEMQSAMKTKDEVTVRTKRSILAEITNYLVSAKRKPTEDVNDEEVLKIIASQAKKRKESIAEFKKGKREDLAKREKEELEILESYLPEKMSKEELMKVVEKIKNETGMDNSGKLIGAVMKELGGRVDGNEVKEAVDSIMS